MSIWAIFDQISDELARSHAGRVDRKVDGLLAALSETIADALPTANQDVLREGATAARRALSALNGVEEWSASFAAGRLAAAADVLGFAAGRAADDEAVALAARAPYASILIELTRGALSNSELSRRLDRSEEHVCRLLKELRQADLITTERRGRNAFNVLTPVGRLLSEDHNPARADIASPPPTRRHSYQLVAMNAANDIGDGAELPRLSMAA